MVLPGLVNIHKTMERSTIFSGTTHYKWSFSIATLNYQRVSKLKAMFFLLLGMSLVIFWPILSQSHMGNKRDGHLIPRNYCPPKWLRIVFSVAIRLRCVFFVRSNSSSPCIERNSNLMRHMFQQKTLTRVLVFLGK